MKEIQTQDTQEFSNSLTSHRFNIKLVGVYLAFDLFAVFLHRLHLQPEVPAFDQNLITIRIILGISAGLLLFWLAPLGRFIGILSLVIEFAHHTWHLYVNVTEFPNRLHSFGSALTFIYVFGLLPLMIWTIVDPKTKLIFSYKQELNPGKKLNKFGVFLLIATIVMAIDHGVRLLGFH